MTGPGAAAEQRDWSGLPLELLDPIIARLTKLAEVICFQAVCKPWKQAVLVYDQQLQRHRPPKFRQSLPWLTTLHYYRKDLTRPNCRSVMNCHHFVDVAHKNKIIRHVGSPRGSVVFGAPSSHLGWQLTRELIAYKRYILLDPFTGNRIPLPSIDTESVKCFAMSADPTTTTKEEECIVMIHYDHGYDGRPSLAFCKLGGVEQQKQGWTSYPSPRICGIVFWRGRFLGLCMDGEVMVCDLDGPNEEQPMVMTWAFLPYKFYHTIGSGRRGTFRHNLAVSPEGELILVTRYRLTQSGGLTAADETIAFIVYKVNKGKQTWVEVKNIGDYALFWDEYKAVYVSTVDHPECRKNCVYYQLDVYNINSRKKVERLFPDDTLDDVCVTDSNTWIFPSNY